MRNAPDAMNMKSEADSNEFSERADLSKIPVGETAVILDLKLEGKLRDYVMRFGFVPGASIAVLRKVHHFLRRKSLTFVETQLILRSHNALISNNRISHRLRQRDSPCEPTTPSTPASLDRGRCRAKRPRRRKNREGSADNS